MDAVDRFQVMVLFTLWFTGSESVARYGIHLDPAGLLDGDEQMKVCAQLYVDSKAPWDEVLGPGKQFKSAPDLKELIRILHAETGLNA